MRVIYGGGVVLVEAFRMGFAVVCGIAGAFPRRVFGERPLMVFAVPGVVPPRSSKIITFTELRLVCMASS
jgi:hypothetical protein